MTNFRSTTLSALAVSLFSMSALLADDSVMPPMTMAALDSPDGPPPCGQDGMCNIGACAADPDCPADLPPRNTPSPKSVEDRIKTYTMNGHANADPAVLISGRYEDDDGSRRCRSWVSFNSTLEIINNLGNWLGNAVFDGCDSEVAVFSRNNAAQLVKPEGRWSSDADEVAYVVAPPLEIPTSVWVVYADTDFADERAELEQELEHANDILANSRCGIQIGPVTYYSKTSALADPEQELGCGRIETIFKPQIGFHENRMNVYVVKHLQDDDRAGVACTAESDNVIVLDQGRSDTALVHEYGHGLDLWHTDNMPGVNARNIMAPANGVERDMLTAGQCYRANFSSDSYINQRRLRNGREKNCSHLQDADNKCPGLKNEF
jgi:hypothetical protein